MILYPVYQTITYLLWPFLYIWPTLRLRQGKEIKTRINERYGITAIKRPQGKLVWIHAASNGEALSALPLIYALQELPSAPTILITTMTVTAAKIMEKRLPAQGCIHQFAPYDHLQWIHKFLNHWSPDLVIWTESELWPNQLHAIRHRKIPAMLVNARLSNKSTERWAWLKPSFQNMMTVFTLILAQTPRDKDNLEQLGLSNVICAGNLKDIALPLPFDPIALDDMRLSTAGRTLLLYASTHNGEEDIAMDAHIELEKTYPNLLTIIVPRHPKRAEEIIQMAASKNLNIAARSLKMSPRPDTQIYLADTLNELGLFYTLCPITFVGNSLNTSPGGGHNLMEPALLDCAIVSGDDLHNFSIQATEMPESDSCVIVKDKESLIAVMTSLLNDNARVQKHAENAHAYAIEKQSMGIDKIFDACKTVFQTARLV